MGITVSGDSLSGELLQKTEAQKKIGGGHTHPLIHCQLFRSWDSISFHYFQFLQFHHGDSRVFSLIIFRKLMWQMASYW